ncbi:LytR family transcriptional regulator [Massilia sp. Root351]|jgi:two-component system LytT family response regulator|uniref:LytR/AlgR family response regulator transcription factor n=1 Tax=Massilia sp. Root351 TaxID=1736522 RepID=UPI00070FCBF1|nr:LytTR family transcriptional regulator DNA-binding domain-containing protein [Massilia sp. Root351]KQV84704.1 LytR family transcriptional regulator [Massilia sp. Root351]
MRIIIVDDEALARGVVREYLAEHADVDVVAECANGFEAVKAITELEPDLAILDIQMPKLDGFEVAELAAGKCRFMFATAFDQFALKAFEYHALDYLLKPFSQQRFDQALTHARASIGKGDRTDSAPPAQDGLAGVVRDAAVRKGPLGRVLIRDGARVHVIAAEKIDYIEAQDDYVQIRSEGKSYLKNQRLSDLENQLEAGKFLRIHRSYLLNIECMSRIEQAGKDSHVAVLKDGTRLPISRSGYQKVRSVIQ